MMSELLDDLKLLKTWDPTAERRKEILEEAIARLRELDGERIEGWTSSRWVEIYKEAPCELTLSTQPWGAEAGVSYHRAILILTEPEEKT